MSSQGATTGPPDVTHTRTEAPFTGRTAGMSCRGATMESCDWETHWETHWERRRRATGTDAGRRYAAEV